ncbi:hypothetical protein [Idiomarina abyssalis]|uniref:hypothetical protein n=1 Tax=Idiomarina abyssalis TaxID=86102 RepID=UPI003A906436
MGSTDRINGFNSAVALKAPVAACATAEIVLAGEQSIDGVSLVDGDRVLVTQQSNPVDNGIYVVTTSNWSRAKDFNGHRDAVKGTRVAITDGEIYAGYEAQLTTENPVQIGASELTFVLLLILDPNDADAVRTVAQNISSIQSASDNAALAQQAQEGAEAAAADAQTAKAGAVAAKEAAETAAASIDPALYRKTADQIETADIANSAVTTDKVEDGAITQNKIDPSVQLGGPSLGSNSIIRTNGTTIDEDITIPAGTNGMSAGPITIAAGRTVTVEGTWTVVGG